MGSEMNSLVNAEEYFVNSDSTTVVSYDILYDQLECVNRRDAWFVSFHRS
jgi:hypothetical protein